MGGKPSGFQLNGMEQGACGFSFLASHRLVGPRYLAASSPARRMCFSSKWILMDDILLILGITLLVSKGWRSCHLRQGTPPPTTGGRNYGKLPRYPVARKRPGGLT